MRQQDALGRARRSLIWFGLCFCVMTCALAWVVERRLPEVRDPEFAVKIEHLRLQIARSPKQPLVVMLGSSRSALGFRAGDVHETRNGVPVLVYNFAILGGGPFLELLCLQRLLASGVHPDYLVIEVFPALLNSAGNHSLEEVWLQSGRMRLSEILHLERFHTQQGRLIRRWAHARAEPWLALHWLLQPSTESTSTEGEALFDYVAGTRMDDHGWIPYYASGVNADQRLISLIKTQAQYRDSMRLFRPADRSVAALETLLATCQGLKIRVALVLMPEGEDFRKFYPPGLPEQLDGLVRKISDRWNAPLVDGRDWVPDSHLADSHHALPSGAVILTRRLAREAIRPLLDSPSGQIVAHAETRHRD
jgi:hypothetical protein